ncbi:MAG: ferrous iron transport protein B [Thermodesulfovibrionia bacterium]
MVCLVGNPNVGKSAIFGLLTGRYVTVSNYPGTTVEIIRGETIIHKDRFLIVDTPGVNTLIPMSEDEKVTRDILLEERVEKVIQVIDTKNIKRGLFLTLQLIEMGIPLIIDLNMKDEAASRGIEIDEKELSNILGIDVVSTIAVQRKGITSLKRLLLNHRVSTYRFSYDKPLEDAISRIEDALPHTPISKRSIALMILSGDRTLRDWLIKNISRDNIALIESIRDEVSERYSQPLSYVITQQRLRLVDTIADRILTRGEIKKEGISRFIGDITTHPVYGVPFLVVVLFLLYEFVGRFGAGVMVDLLEDVVFGKYLNPWANRLVTTIIPIRFIQELLIGPYGMITMALTYAIAIILPITTTFFIAFALMEDTGYLPRLAIMLNKVFRLMGLNGKAVLPMILGLGCDTMATLTTRILDTPKERLIVTLLLALGVPCSAQLGVILGMFGKQPLSAALVWGGVVLGVIIFVGFLSSRIFPGERADFILEIPPIRLPLISNVLIKTTGRIEWYLKEAVPLFILGTLILFVADKLGILPFLQRLSSPVIVGLLGLPERATESFIMGFLRRDYGAAGLFSLQEHGLLNTEQVVVSLVTITLFIPCIANLFVIIKERGLKTAAMISAFIFPFSIFIGALLHRTLLWLRVFP